MSDEIKQFEPDSNVWINDFGGPKQAVFVRSYDKEGYKTETFAVVVFHGKPEVHEIEKVFRSQSHCLRVAAKKHFERGTHSLKIAEEMRSKADAIDAE